MSELELEYVVETRPQRSEARMAERLSGEQLHFSPRLQLMWRPFLHQLSAVECLSFTGIFFRRDIDNPSEIRHGEIHESDTVAKAEWFLTQSFRTCLRKYCGMRDRFNAEEGASALWEILHIGFRRTTEAAVAGIVEALSTFFLKAGSKTWCDRYGPKNGNGDGYYYLDSTSAFHGKFELKYLPAIQEYSRDKHCPIKNFTVKILVPQKTEVKFFNPTFYPYHPIVDGYRSPGLSWCEFEDQRTGKQVTTRVAKLFGVDNEKILDFSGFDTKFGEVA